MYGRTSPEAVRYSQALDKLIAKYQLFLFRKAMMAA
jgi:hypothetical protein